MAKAVPDNTMDAMLDYIALSDTMYACSGEPANFAGIASVALADVAMAGGDFTKANDVSGRKVTMGAKAAVPIDANGTATHVVLARGADSTLRLVTTCTSQVLTSGGTVDFPSWKHNVQDPT